MATTRPFSYNSAQSAITGTINIGTLCIGVSPLAYSANPGGLTWWMGPDEDNSYVIAKDVSTTNFPTPVGNVGNVQFWRSTNTDEAFTNLVSLISGTAQASASEASNWLLTNGYWTNYDAQAFINAASITNTTQKTAIDTLVNGLKADSLWTKMLAIYPFVGGTSSTCKFNLKNPLDTDAAFRLNFQGGWTFSDNGVQPNGTTAYANTFLSPLTSLAYENSSISHYSRTNSVATGTPYGTKTGGAIASIYLALNTGGGTNVFHNTNIAVSPFPQPTRTDINLIQSRIDGSNVIVALNGTAGSYTSGELILSNRPIYLGARNSNNTAIDLYYTREMAFAHIGTGLTQAQCTQLYNRIQTFQTTLNRHV